MDPELIAVIGMVIGLTLLVLEFFVPSGGLIFVIACVSLLGGVWGAWNAWGQDNFPVFAVYVGLMFVLAPGSVIGGLFLLNNTKLGDRILLKPPTADEISGFEKESDRLQQLVGRRGIAKGLLNPGGMVDIDGSRYHCETPGMLIDPGTEVEVISVKGNRLVVRVPFEPETSQDIAEAEPQLTAGDSAQADDATDDAFDFDIPEDS